MKKKLFALLLSAAMLLGGCAAPTATEEPAAPPQEAAPTAAPTQTPVQEAPQETVPSAEPTGDVVILYTSDVHCGIDQGFGYAGLQQVKEYLLSEGDEVILVDNGDSIQGEPIGTMSRGEAIVELMNTVGYDLAIPGNHEFDYGMEQFFALTELAEFSYLSCNLNKEGELVLEPYAIREAAGKKIAFVGVTTPKTLTSSTPANFQNDEGEFIYGFCREENGEALYRAVQSAVDSARAEGAEYVYVMGHVGNEADCVPWTYSDIIANTSGIDVFLDGHSHDTDQIVMKNKDGEEVLRSACGTKLSCIGWSRIAADGSITCGLYTWNNEIAAPELLGIENSAAEAVRDHTADLEDMLKEVVARSTVELTINDAEAVDNNGSPIRMVRRAETNLGDLCADAYRAQSGADIAVVNGGGIRVSISAGEITRGDILSVNPFGNEMCVIEVSGQQILDALEWACRVVPEEQGGFLQVSGMSFEIHTYIESSCVSDEDGMFVGIGDTRRVRNVLVGGEPLDPSATYSLAGNDYTLVNHGGGYTMFDGAPLLQDRVKLDNQVLIDYITQTLGGTIGEEYADPYGQGRITVVETQP